MVKEIKTENGGYYAIKGFVYQMDKTILEILENPESEISFEQKQDINFDDEVIQVKYKEQATYYPSSVKKPIIQLIELFQKDQAKKYHLYAYFGDQEEGVKNLSLDELNTILGNNDFDESLKNSFLSAFTFNFSKNFDEHFESVIEKIKTEFSYSSDEDAVFAHGIILDHLFRKITNNQTTNIQERKSSKSELTNIISNHKSCIFYSAYREFLKDEEYFSLIKKKYFTWRNIDDFERFIWVELQENEALEQIKTTILGIKNKFYCSANRAIKSGAPFIYLSNITPENLQATKQALNEEGHLLKDGHDFLNAVFSSKSLKEPSTKDNGICLKFLNTEDNFLEMIAENFGKTKEIYQFFINTSLKIESDNKNIKIQIQNLSDILSIL
jgi:hypothetical protein